MVRDVGYTPYHLLRPILLKLDNVNQLREIEENSPHIREDDAECWERLITRTFPRRCAELHLKPEHPTEWSLIYDEYDTMEKNERQAALEKLSKGYKSLNKAKDAKVTKLIDYDAKVLGPAPGGRNRSKRFQPKPTPARSVMRKVRRQLTDFNRQNRLITPTGRLPVPAGQIKRAPPAMAEDYRVKSLPAVGVARRPLPATESSEHEDNELEARLLKLKTKVAHNGTSMDSDDELFDEDDAADSSNFDRGQSAFNSRKHASSTPAKTPASSASLTGLAKMKMGRSWKNKPVTLSPVHTDMPKATSSKAPTSSPSTKMGKLSVSASGSRPSTAIKQDFSSHVSPSAGLGNSANADSVESSKPRPITGQKRKPPPNIFMPLKNKPRRLS